MDMELAGRMIVTQGRIPRIARLEEEWYEDIEDPETLINELRKIALFALWQGLQDYKESILSLLVSRRDFWSISGQGAGGLHYACRRGKVRISRTNNLEDRPS